MDMTGKHEQDSMYRVISLIDIKILDWHDKMKILYESLSFIINNQNDHIISSCTGSCSESTDKKLPNCVSFASLIASSSLLKQKSGATGPNTSSLMCNHWCTSEFSYKSIGYHKKINADNV